MDYLNDEIFNQTIRVETEDKSEDFIEITLPIFHAKQRFKLRDYIEFILIIVICGAFVCVSPSMFADGRDFLALLSFVCGVAGIFVMLLYALYCRKNSFAIYNDGISFTYRRFFRLKEEFFSFGEVGVKLELPFIAKYANFRVFPIKIDIKSGKIKNARRIFIPACYVEILPEIYEQLKIEGIDEIGFARDYIAHKTKEAFEMGAVAMQKDLAIYALDLKDKYKNGFIVYVGDEMSSESFGESKKPKLLRFFEAILFKKVLGFIAVIAVCVSVMLDYADKQAYQKIYDDSIAYNKSECDLGNQKSCYDLGYKYLEGAPKYKSVIFDEIVKFEPFKTMTQKNYEARIKSYKNAMQKSCDFGNAMGCYEVAEFFYGAKFNGRLNEIDYKLARQYGKRACAELKNADICVKLATLEEDILDKEQVAELLSYLKVGCDDLGDADACYTLAKRYDEGLGRSSRLMLDKELISQKQALHYYDKVCELDGSTCAWLAEKYVVGGDVGLESVKPNLAKIRHYFIKTCEFDEGYDIFQGKDFCFAKSVSDEELYERASAYFVHSDGCDDDCE